MATESLGIAASNITAALISTDIKLIQGKNITETVENAAGLYAMVLSKMKDQDRQGNL